MIKLDVRSENASASKNCSEFHIPVGCFFRHKRYAVHCCIIFLCSYLHLHIILCPILQVVNNNAVERPFYICATSSSTLVSGLRSLVAQFLGRICASRTSQPLLPTSYRLDFENRGAFICILFHFPSSRISSSFRDSGGWRNFKLHARALSYATVILI